MIDPLSITEKLIFGPDAKRHAITGRVLELGSGALLENEQTELHCRDIDAKDGRATGNDMRRKCGLPIAEEIAAAAAEAERKRLAREKAAYAALDEKEAADAKAQEAAGPLSSKNMH
jgi:hypothetical protein